MIPHVIQITLPTWVQIVVSVTAILANLSTALFVLLVLWPSIRNQERRTSRIEKWFDGPDGRRVIRAIQSKIDQADGLGQAGKPVDRARWTDDLRQEGDL